MVLGPVGLEFLRPVVEGLQDGQGQGRHAVLVRPAGFEAEGGRHLQDLHERMPPPLPAGAEHEGIGVAGFEDFARPGPVLGEVSGRKMAAAVLAVADPGVGQPSPVQGRAAAFRQGRQGVGQGRIAEMLAGRVGRAVGLEEQGARSGIAAQLMALLGPQGAEMRGDPETVPRQGDRRGEDLGQRQQAPAPMSPENGRNPAGDGNRGESLPAVRGRDDRRGSLRNPGCPVEGGAGSVGQRHQHLRPAGNAGVDHIRGHQGQGCGHRGVDGIAAGREDSAPGLGGKG